MLTREELARLAAIERMTVAGITHYVRADAPPEECHDPLLQARRLPDEMSDLRWAVSLLRRLHARAEGADRCMRCMVQRAEHQRRHEFVERVPGRTYVVNVKSARIVEYDVNIMRTGRWGNPYADGSRASNVARHRTWVLGQPLMMQDIREQLSGRVLGCCCKPAACHGDILAAIANQRPASGGEEGRAASSPRSV